MDLFPPVTFINIYAMMSSFTTSTMSPLAFFIFSQFPNMDQTIYQLLAHSRIAVSSKITPTHFIFNRYKIYLAPTPKAPNIFISYSTVRCNVNIFKRLRWFSVCFFPRTVQKGYDINEFNWFLYTLYRERRVITPLQQFSSYSTFLENRNIKGKGWGKKYLLLPSHQVCFLAQGKLGIFVSPILQLVSQVLVFNIPSHVSAFHFKSFCTLIHTSTSYSASH